MTTAKAIIDVYNVDSGCGFCRDDSDSCVLLDTVPIVRYLENIYGNAQLSVIQRVRLHKLLFQLRRK